MKNQVIFLALAISFIFLQCDPAPIEPDPNPNLETPTDLVTANNQLGFELLKELNEDEPADNLFISPFSVNSALGMTLNGANGSTTTAMQNAMQVRELTVSEVNEGFQNLNESLPVLDEHVIFNTANAIFYKNTFSVLPAFLETNNSFYNAEISPLDFSDASSVDVINDWVSDKTEEKIPTIINEIGDGAVMYLINAIYFLADWRLPFDPEKTVEQGFQTESGATEMIDMMQQPKHGSPTYSNEKFDAVDLAYGDSIYSMTLFLPKTNYSVHDIISDFNTDNWNTWIEGLATQDLYLGLPKFTMEYKTSLKPALRDLGMDVAFGSGADFSNINSYAALQISDVIHKTFIEVDEEGTEAAAVTAVIIENTSVTPTLNLQFNKPFVFAIRDNETNSVLFLGKMMNPNE